MAENSKTRGRGELRPIENRKSKIENAIPPSQFPSVRWNRRTVVFEPVVEPSSPLESRAVIVFARCGECFVLADIPGRGWTVPSGRIEPGETPGEAAARETWEEIGAALEDAREIGRYVLTEVTGDAFCVPVFVGTVRVFGAIPPNSESRGACCVPRAELPACYYTWDPLLERMFEYAESCLSTP
jgi:8-oxo-dGTP diphosphatase